MDVEPFHTCESTPKSYIIGVIAGVAELADALDSGSSVHYGRGGSNPLTRTIHLPRKFSVERAIFLPAGDRQCDPFNESAKR